MNFTKDQIKLIAEAERMMDDGAPFVRSNDGTRIICRQACMDEFGLRHGQTIDHFIFLEILKWNIADCEAAITELQLKSREGAP